MVALLAGLIIAGITLFITALVLIGVASLAMMILIPICEAVGDLTGGIGNWLGGLLYQRKLRKLGYEVDRRDAASIWLHAARYGRAALDIEVAIRKRK